MSIRRNKERAERLAGEADAERRARRDHLARARDIFGRRLGSPAGLAVCFGAGAIAGLRFDRGPVRWPGDRDEEGGGDRQEAGFLERMNDTAVGNILIRLAAAALVRFMFTPPAHTDGAEAAGEMPGDLAGS